MLSSNAQLMENKSPKLNQQGSTALLIGIRYKALSIQKTALQSLVDQEIMSQKLIQQSAVFYSTVNGEQISKA